MPVYFISPGTLSDCCILTLSGIDILTRDEIIKTIIRDYRVGEQTIIISTHEIQEIEGSVDAVSY